MEPHLTDRLTTLPLSPGMASLARRGTPRSYRKGVLLIEEGGEGGCLYLVVQGRLKAFSTDTRGREVTYGIYGAGELLGEMSLDGGPRSASVMAVEPSTCLLITRQTLLNHISEQPEFALELIGRVAARARSATRNAKSLALMDAYGRVAQLLQELAVQQADGSRLIPVRLTHAEIAGRVGCSREMVSRLLKDLTTGGYVERAGQGYRLMGSLPPRW